MKYFKKLEGEHIYLSPRNTEDVEKYTQWLNDFDITDYLGRSGSLTTLDSEKEYLEQNSKEMNNKYNFAIVKKENDEMIGGCGIEDINFINRRGTLGIFIGDKASQNHGYGTETIKLLLDYGFNYLNLHSIKLDLMEFNERALACYKKCGFKEYGRRRESNFINGKYYDTISMDILKDEFTESYIKHKNQ